jgi:hypothetical protein
MPADAGVGFVDVGCGVPGPLHTPEQSMQPVHLHMVEAVGSCSCQRNLLGCWPSKQDGNDTLRRHCQQPVQLGSRERLGQWVLHAPRQAHAACLRSDWVHITVSSFLRLLPLMLCCKAPCSCTCAVYSPYTSKHGMRSRDGIAVQCSTPTAQVYLWRLWRPCGHRFHRQAAVFGARKPRQEGQPMQSMPSRFAPQRLCHVAGMPASLRLICPPLQGKAKVTNIPLGPQTIRPEVQTSESDSSCGRCCRC